MLHQPAQQSTDCRFNIHQEILLAAIYRAYNFRTEPIFFYTAAVFCLQGLYLCALYLLAWSLSGTWLAGLLTAVWLAVNRSDPSTMALVLSADRPCSGLT